VQFEARFGEPGNKMASALRRCLALEDPDVLGCVAQLVTVQDEGLVRLLSTTFKGLMQLLVVTTTDAQKRLTSHLGTGRVGLLLCLEALRA
jgi:chromosome segregation ATPase